MHYSTVGPGLSGPTPMTSCNWDNVTIPLQFLKISITLRKYGCSDVASHHIYRDALYFWEMLIFFGIYVCKPVKVQVLEVLETISKLYHLTKSLQ
jgi:hypothetical protein